MSLKVLKRKYLPTNLPLLQGAVLWLVLDKAQPTDLWLGIWWTLYGVLSMLCLIVVFSEDQCTPAELVKEDAARLLKAAADAQSRTKVRVP